LLDAGFDAFGTRGYPSTTIEGLCAAAGVAPRSFYEHFASREALLVAVYDEVIAGQSAALLAALAAEPEDLATHVRAGVSAAVEAFTRDERRARIALVEVVGVSETVEAHRMEVLAGYAELLARDGERLAERGLASRHQGTLTAMALVGAITQVLTDWQHRPEARAPVGSLVDEITRLYVAALR
jgi:AcrR family transcriptional regulator